MWIPAGSYRFRADQFDLQFFSAEENHCTVPECTIATVTTLGMQQVVTEQTIDYTYDPLNRLTGAVYDDGSNYTYTYDAVGNRLTETIGEATNQYTYDAANRLASVNGQAYTWDANGNLLSDGVQNYTYNYANRLTQVVKGSDTYQYQYNGLGDRLQTILNGTGTTYSLDLNSGLTQVLADGTNTYTYGYNRIAQVSETQTGYFLGDALGSVRQVVDPQAEILLAQSYSPYGVELSKVGDYATAYNYTGEMTDGTGLVNLRARYYDPGTGRFVSRDAWGGNIRNPLSLNKWGYANCNPLIYTDPSGNIPRPVEVTDGSQVYSCNCGWIDFSHANSRTAMQIFKGLSDEKSQFAFDQNNYGQNTYGIVVTSSVTGLGNFSGKFIVEAGLDQFTKESVAYGIYRMFSEDIEIAQGKKNLLWFTHYSFEDLTSDDIGFFLALKYKTIVDPSSNNGVNGDSWKWLSKLCGFDSDRLTSINNSKIAYKEYGDAQNLIVAFLNLLINTPQIKTWGTPLLCEVEGLCNNGETKEWPTEFSTLKPSPEGLHWWKYNEMD